jgi:tetratricopeptide (TPR) repeat protein
VLYNKKVLGQALHRQGRLDEAVVWYAEVYNQRRQRYGDEHPLTLNAAGQLGAAYNSLNRPAEAEPLLQRGLAARIARGEGDSREALIDRVILITTLEKLDRNDEAMAMADAALALEQGQPNRDTIAARNARAMLLLKAGQVTAARSAFTELLELAPAVLGPNAPSWPVLLSNASTADLAAQDPAAARDKLEIALPLLDASAGSAHPRTQEALRRLIDANERLGLEADAAALRARLATDS